MGESGINNLFTEYEPIVIIGESNIHDLFSRYESILVTINKLEMISSSFCRAKLFSIRTTDSRI